MVTPSRQFEWTFPTSETFGAWSRIETRAVGESLTCAAQIGSMLSLQARSGRERPIERPLAMKAELVWLIGAQATPAQRSRLGLFVAGERCPATTWI